MTSMEKARHLIEKRSCAGFMCSDAGGDCPLHAGSCGVTFGDPAGGVINDVGLRFLNDWIAKHTTPEVKSIPANLISIEKVEKILDDGYCDTVACSNCPGGLRMGHSCNAARQDGGLPLEQYCGLDAEGINFFRAYLEKNKKEKPGMIQLHSGQFFIENCRCFSPITISHSNGETEAKIFTIHSTIKNKAQRRREILARLKIE